MTSAGYCVEPKQTVTNYCNQKRENSPWCFHYDTIVFSKVPIEMTIHGLSSHKGLRTPHITNGLYFSRLRGRLTVFFFSSIKLMQRHHVVSLENTI